MAKKNSSDTRQLSLFSFSTAEPVQKGLFDTEPEKPEMASEPVQVGPNRVMSEDEHRLIEKAADDRLLNKLESMTVAELEAEVHRHNELFNQGNTEISDLVYDKLVQRLRDMSADSDVADELTSPDVSSGRAKVRHEKPMLSIHKPNILRVFEEIGNWLKTFDGDVIATPKIDGLACSVEYDENGDIKVASTRGDGRVGEDITANARYIDAIPKHIDRGPLEVRGEVYMPLDAFRAFEGEKISARNLAVGGLKQKNAPETAKYHLSFFAYETINGNFLSDREKFEELERLGFTVPERWLFKRDVSNAVLLHQLEQFSHRMIEARETWNFDADGIVFKADDNREQEDMGVTDHHPKCAIACKFPCMEQVSVLREVQWQVAKGARITPVAIFDKVELAGALVQKATLSNIEMIKKFPIGRDGLEKNGPKTYLKIGSQILVSRRGDVIPHVEYVLNEPGDAVDVEIPKVCPSCGTEAVEDGLLLLCPNTENCPAIGQALIENYTKVTGCMGVGGKIIENLYDAGLVETPADLYRLTVDDIAKAVSASDDGSIDPDAVLPQKLYDSIQNSRKQPLAKFLEALSIPAMGRVNSNTIADGMESIEGVMKADFNALFRVMHGEEFDIDSIQKHTERIFKIIHKEFQPGMSLEVLESDDVSKLAKSVKIEISKKYKTSDELLDASMADIFAIARECYCNDKIVRACVEGIAKRRKLIEDLLQYVEVEKVQKASLESFGGNGFAGKTFLFTGALEHMKREDAQERVEKLGGKAVSGVSKTLSVLVATSNTSSKWQKAQQLNEKGASIQLWTEAEFIEALEKAESNV